jgi:hypothetical protein
MQIHATIARNVDGLDLDLFEQALLARRESLQVRHTFASVPESARVLDVGIVTTPLQATSSAADSSSNR